MGRTEEQSVQNKDNNRVEVEEYETINDLVNAMKRNAMLFGMSMEEFWYDNPQNFYLRGDVYKRKQEEKVEVYDYIAWRIGMYTMLGTQQTLSTKHTKIFPEEPFVLKEREKKEKQLKAISNLPVKVENELQQKILMSIMQQGFVYGNTEEAVANNEENKDGC